MTLPLIIFNMYPPFSPTFEKWAPFVGRLILGGAFVFGALWKIPGTEMFAMQVAQTAATWWPFATISVFLAFILEAVGGLALIVGWKTRIFATVFAAYVALLTVLFNLPDMQDPMSIGTFINHLIFIAGLLYVSVYGAKAIAISKD
jgi:putative oxidoreductase